MRWKEMDWGYTRKVAPDGQAEAQQLQCSKSNLAPQEKTLNQVIRATRYTRWHWSLHFQFQTNVIPMRLLPKGGTSRLRFVWGESGVQVPQKDVTTEIEKNSPWIVIVSQRIAKSK